MIFIHNKYHPFFPNYILIFIYLKLKMSHENLEQTLVQEPIQPKKVLEEIQQAREEEMAMNESDVADVPKLSVNKSNSENSLHNVNLAASLLPDKVQESNENEKVEEELTTKIPDDYFYDEKHIENIHSESPIPEAVVKLDGFYGHDSFKRYNAQILDRDTIIYAAGISYTIFNHFTKDKKIFYTKDKGGIGSISVHPNKKYFAVAEMGVWPNIYIYQYPSLKLHRILRKGTEKSYSCITFSGTGSMLASVGSDPDFLLTVWDWKQQKLLLKSKAFSQEVYKVSFSQFNEKWLTTSGTGHIRFWKISETFTGLKLQGDIAKFGQFELSDVVSYAEFEDGNVVSSSEYGKLLLWQGNLVKSVVAINDKTPCHKGHIEYVRLYKKKIITAGSDGFIRFWDANQINLGESDEKFNLYIQPEKQIYFESNSKKPAYINWIHIDHDFWIVQDALGSIWKYHPENDKRQQIMTFNSGKFLDFAVSPLNNCIVSTGYDGYVRLWDYGNKKQFYNRQFGTTGQSTCIQWLPFSKRNSGRMIVVGFSDGIVRFLGLDEKNFTLIKAFKVHKNAITKVKCNRQGNVVVVADTTGSLFFLALDSVILNKITPYCFFETGYKINDLSWDKNGEKILLGCQDGQLHEISVPKEKDCDFSQSFLHKYKERSFTIKMMQSQKPNREDLELQLLLKKTKGGAVDEVIVDEQWDSAPIMNATYFGADSNRVLCSVEGNYLGKYYVVDFNKDRPIASIDVSKHKTSYLHFNQTNDMLFIGFRNGSWEIRHKYEPANYLKKYCFDQNYGVVKKIAMNVENTALIAASEDGTMLVHKFDISSFNKGVKNEVIQAIQVNIPSVILGISGATFSDKIDYGKQIQSDITDSSIYSLQDQKLKAEEDMKLSQADKVKNKKLKKIKELQDLFKEILETNKSETDNLAKLTKEELIVDPEYAAAFQKRIDQEQEQTRKELSWDEEYAELSKRKLQKYFIDNLEFDKFKVKAFETNVIVSTFKMKKLTPFIQAELDKIEKIIQEEQSSNYGDRKDKTVSSFQQSKAMLELKLKDQKKNGKEENFEVKNKIREAEIQFEKELAQANATKGDYKLKSSADYEVPENERLNVSRKKKHLFVHYQYLYEEKKDFNKRLNNLKKRKIELVEKLGPINDKLRKINKELHQEQEDIVFQIDQDVQGIEADIEVEEDQIAQYVLQKQKEKQASKKTGGMGMGGNQQTTTENKNDFEKLKKVKKIKIFEKKEERNAIHIKPRANIKVKRSALEEQVIEIKRIQLKAEKQKIKSQLEAEIKRFDEELEQLKNIKYQLQSDLNLVEMKILTYGQEFIIFRDMETYDNSLTEQLNNYGSQKNSLETTFLQLSTEINQIETLNDELKKKFEEEKRVLKQFVYPEDDEMRERIIKYYKIRERKRINKLKKQAELEEKQKNSENENSDEEGEEQEEEEQDSEDEYDDEDEKPDITVIENDHKNFERVRKICQYDEKIQEYTRKKSDLEKQRNQTRTKINNISTSLTQAEKQLKSYQKKKLLKVNQVIISLPLKLSQIEFMVKMNGKSKLHEEFNNAIVFTHKSFVRLGERIEELKKQKLDIEKKQKNLNKKLAKLTEQVEKSSFTIESKRKEYEEKQLLKFGSTFELQKLKELEPSDLVLETRDLYKKEEREVSKKIQKIKEELQERKRQLLEAKRQNTKVITEITQLGDKENSLKKMLDSTNKQLFKNHDVSKKDELEKERQNLKDLIKFLSKEIEDLKTEIGLFKRKGGHIYTMVTSNKKNFS